MLPAISRLFSGLFFCLMATSSCTRAPTIDPYSSEPSGARLFCYQCDEHVWSSLREAAQAAIERFAVAVPQVGIELGGRQPSPQEIGRSFRLTKFEYVLAPGFGALPQGATASGLLADGVAGIRKAIRLELRYDESGKPETVDLSCQGYLFEGDVATLQVFAQLVGDGSSKWVRTVPSQTLLDAALVCLGGALDPSISDGAIYAIQGSELGDFAHARLLGATLAR